MDHAWLLALAAVLCLPTTKLPKHDNRDTARQRGTHLQKKLAQVKHQRQRLATKSTTVMDQQ